MRRRDFIKVFIGSAVTWPSTARAQQPSLPVVGFLSSRSPVESEHDVAGFRLGLSQSGYVEHQSVVIEYRWAENQYDRLPALAADLVKRQVRVIAALGGPVTALAVKAATKTIPFVFITGVDPVKLGLVASFAKPGGNATGVNMFITAVEAKRLGLLHELVPSARQIAVIVNPNSPEVERQLSDLQGAAQAIGCELQIFRVSAETEFNVVFATLAQNSVRAVLVAADPFFNSQRARIVALAERHKIPAHLRGTWLCHSRRPHELWTQSARYVSPSRIVHRANTQGAKPADLPVMQPTALELVINLKTAKAIGLDVSTQLQQRADEVIE
jgi:putative tryptophan/tyrosine transport system substrate-binding protein